MAMKFGTGNVNEVVWKDANNNSKVVTAVKFNGSFVYARKGTYTTGTLPTGVGSLAASRTATIEPTAPTNITISSGGTIYHADALAFTVTPTNNLWTATCSNSSVVLNLLSTTSVSGVALSGASASPKTRLVNVSTDPHVSLVTINYYTGTTASSRQVQGDMTDSFNVSAPYTVSWTASYDNYWTGTTSGSSGPATATYSISIQSTGRTYNLVAAWSLGTVTFHTSAAAAASGSNPITSATYNSTLYIRQVASNMYFDENGSTVSTKSLVLNTDNFSFAGIATVKNSVLDDPTYYRITINSTMRGDVYYNNTKILSPSFDTQTVYKYKQRGDNGQTNIYAQYVGSMSGSSLLSSSNDNYGTASDSYTSSTSAYTFSTISGNKTVNLQGGLQRRELDLTAGPDGRKFTVTYRDLTGAKKTVTHGGFATNNLMTNTTYNAIDVWRGATVTWAAASATNWPAASGTFAPGTTSITINRTSSYDWVTAETHGTLYIYASGMTMSTSMAASGTYWMARNPAKITPTSASSKTGSTTISGSTVTYTISSSSSTITVQVKSSSGGVQCPYDLYRIKNTTVYPPAVYRRKDDAVLVLYNPNDCPMEIFGRFYIATPMGITSMTSAAVITSELAAGESITVGTTSLRSPTTWSYSFQCRPCSGTPWGSAWNSMGY